MFCQEQVCVSQIKFENDGLREESHNLPELPKNDKFLEMENEKQNQILPVNDTDEGVEDAHEVANTTNSAKFYCFMCNSNFGAPTKDLLRKHFVTTHDYKPFTCNLCDFRTSHKYKIKHHYVKHAIERNFHCSECDYSGKIQRHLQWHMNTHTGKRLYKCNICEYQVRNLCGIKNHIEGHIANKLFCYLCDYSTNIKKYIKSHVLTHTDIPLLRCLTCGYQTSLKPLMRKHMIQHHMKTTGKKPECLLCKYNSSLPEVLKHHIKIHICEDMVL